MSQYLDMNGNVILEIAFPTEHINKLLKELNFPDAEKIGELPFEQKQILVLASFREFLKGSLLLEEFSEVASHIKMLFPMETKTVEQEDYELMIYEAADMSLYVRTFDANYGNTFGGYMDTMWNYFNKYKHMLENLPKNYSTPSPLEKG
jgi:hypothetical protein